MLISHKGHTDTIQVYSVTVMTHVKALQAGQSSQGTSEPITPVFAMDCVLTLMDRYVHSSHMNKITHRSIGIFTGYVILDESTALLHLTLPTCGIICKYIQVQPMAVTTATPYANTRGRCVTFNQ